jgi:hypothetical protein
MTEQLGRRCALVMLVSLSLAAMMGVIAWGPILFTDAAHDYAGQRPWLGLADAANVLANAPMFFLGAWGWVATKASRWPAKLQAPWCLFHLFAMSSAVAAAVYHALPGDLLFVLSHVCMTSCFVVLTLGVLAERVDARFGTVGLCRLAILAVALAGCGMWIGRAAGGGLDMRPLILLQIIPVLLIPTGALGLPGSSTRAFDWIIVLALYAFAKLLEAGDETIFRATGWLSGHTLMHLALAAAVGWMGYCAALARAGARSTRVAAGESSHRETSLNTVS